MSQINIRGAKRGPLIDLLSRTDLRHNHELYVCSCYFDIRSAKVLIRDVLSAIKISSVSIFIDRREAILIGVVELNRFMAEINKLVKTKLLVVDHHHLFHTKAYAVVSMLDGECRRGSLVVGSANLLSHKIKQFT